MLLQDLTPTERQELKNLIETYPKEYKRLTKVLSKQGRYYPGYGYYGIQGYSYLADDTYILGGHFYYDCLTNHDEKIKSQQSIAESK